MTIIMFGGKRRGLQAKEHHPTPEARGGQHHVVGGLCCRRGWCTSQNRWHHEVGKLCWYIEATSQDISQEVKAWLQMGLPNGQWPQAYIQSCGKIVFRMKKDNKVKVLEWPSKPWPQSHIKFVGRTEKACASKEAYKPDSVTPAVRRNRPKFTQFFVGRLWKATLKVWPRTNNLKAILPNTNWVYVNFWPTGNLMKEIKAEISHSLYYYSDISHS